MTFIHQRSIGSSIDAEQEADVTVQAIDTLYVGIDVDDPFCRIFAVDSSCNPVVKRSIAREYIWMSLPPANRIVVGIEYRSCVHDLARKLMRAGLEVNLIRFRDIPRLRDESSGSHYGCAEALCEAVRTGSARHVPILAPGEQGHAASQRVKALLKRQRSAILNAARTIVESVDAEQGLKVRDDRDIGHRLRARSKSPVSRWGVEGRAGLWHGLLPLWPTPFGTGS